MPKYLVVTNEDNKTAAHMYKQLLDGIAAANKVFKDGGAMSVESKSSDISIEQASVVLELHDGDQDAFVFRIPNLLSGQLVFESSHGLQYVKAKKDRAKNNGPTVSIAGEYTLVSF